MKKKNLIITGIFLILCIVAIICFIFFNKNEEKPEEILQKYISNLNDEKYEDLYSLISLESQNKISKEDFVSRNEKIYDGIDASEIKLEINEIEKEDKNYKVSYTEEMSTSAGKINFSSSVDLVNEDSGYKIDWSSNFIFPDLNDDDKVKVETLEAQRGSILDRNDNILAGNGTVSSVGIVPGKMSESREEDIAKIAELLDISTDSIQKALSASYVKNDTFVPIKKVSKDATELKDKLLEIPGIKITSTQSRVYPLGKEASHLIGYVQNINADELKENEGKGYNSNSIIGKTGLEKAYEDTLRGIDGTEIYIEDKNGNTKKVIAKQEMQNGKNVKLTIDSEMQKKLYNQLENDRGFFVVMQPHTGELLALVSTPSFDSNDFVLGMSNDKWNELNEDVNKPLYNRYLQTYCPGSTFKPITGAIGVTTGKIDPDEDYGYSGTSWQKDSSWGNYTITTQMSYSGPKNLLNGIRYSDNIYFAQSALKIGTDTLQENLNKIWFNKNMDFPLNVKASQYSNEDNITTEIKLADTGYGQGDLLVNPIHMASIYSAFANYGNMIKPYIEYKENFEGEVLVENAFSTSAAKAVKEALVQVVESGTAKDAKIDGITLAGKTGTAELKTSREDEQRDRLGWFNCFTINDYPKDDLLIISMVEDMDTDDNGGSHYLIQKIKTLFE